MAQMATQREGRQAGRGGARERLRLGRREEGQLRRVERWVRALGARIEVAMPSLAQVTRMFSTALPNLAAGAGPRPSSSAGETNDALRGRRGGSRHARRRRATARDRSAFGQPAVARAGARKVAAKEAPLSASISSTSRRAKKSAEETDAQRRLSGRSRRWRLRWRR